MKSSLQTRRRSRFHVLRFAVFAASVTLAFSLTCSTLIAEVRLPGFFDDHMVLQQGKPILIWGWADPGEAISVQIGDHSTDVKADEQGKWKASLPEMTASKTAISVTVKCSSNAVTLSDVLIGEVWLCSGQSNMEWTVRSSTNAPAEIKAADYPLIRHMKVAHRPSTTPLDDIPTQWQICSPETVANFTACGYFMARKLQQELDVPIGLINSSWGGTRVEPWTAPVGFEKVEATRDIFTSVVGRTPGTPQYRTGLNNYIQQTETWLSQARAAMAEQQEVKPSPSFPAELTPFTNHQQPTMLYNGMIHALVGLPIRGAIWYQGESNHVEGMMYFEKKKALINGWRELWGQGDFPFYYVQIAPYHYGSEDAEILAELWEAQAAVEQLPNTGMVVINDIATVNDIHPPNKQDVGLRLANLALKHDYGKTDVVAHSPTVDSIKVQPQNLTVTFKNTGGGLKTRDDKAPSHFEVIGRGSNGFQPATAKVERDAVVLSSDLVASPVAFRFAWNKLAEPNLVGGTGLPVGAARGGKVPQFMDLVPDASDYELVYELDLSKLKGNIQYDVDNRKKIAAFDRIAYLVELDSSEHGDQKVFVSMGAFTADVNKIGVPSVASQAKFQTAVSDMLVYSNAAGVTAGAAESGNIEFWPNNYVTENDKGQVPGAAGNLYDFGDDPVEPSNGYGSMQVHNTAKGETIFAINNWKQGANGDLGIGNSAGASRDWTFTGGAGSYKSKRLRVFVRPTR